MITLTDVSKTYAMGKTASVHAVRGVSLHIEKGQFATIVGRSGSGKTTLLNLAAGLTQPTTGQVVVNGLDLWKLNDTEQSSLRNRTLGFVFQFPSLLPTLTVFENVILPNTFDRTHAMKNLTARARDLLDQVGLTEKLDVYPRQLSAGQQQRVVIARALIHQPEILLADEPTSNLDERTEMEIMDLFHTLHKNLNLTILLVTHTTQLVSVGMRKIEMVAGEVV